MKVKPVVYQILPRLFGNKNKSLVPNGSIEQNGCGKMDDLNSDVLSRIRKMGATHVWYTGIIRHATTTDYSGFGIPRQHAQVVKGKAGSPYAVTDYYDVDPDIATNVEKRMEEFMALVRRTHEAGMKVVIDFVPNHVAREYHSVAKPELVKDLGADDDNKMHFSTGNNFYYCWGLPLDTSDIPFDGEERYEECPAKATGNDHFDNHPHRDDWYETVKLNYGIDYCDAGGRSCHFTPIPDTWSKMTDILMFWASKGIDAFRCDMAEMVPDAFWCWATDKVKFAYPRIQFIGEVYDPAQYRNYIRAGFDYLYDKVGMYDCVRDVMCGRRAAGDITSQWQVNDDIFQHMLYFLENHDEQRIASEFFAGDAQKGIPGMIVSALLNTNPVMVYAGQEFGEKGMDEEGFSGRDGRTTIFDYWSVDTLRRGFFDRRTLRKPEREWQRLYTRILTAANKEVAIREGKLYDLMYVNPQMADKQFAFLRKAEGQLMVVVANFDEMPAVVDVNIPTHAFEYLQFRPADYEAVELLTDSQQQLSITDKQPLRLNVPPCGGLVLRVKL